MPLVPRATPEPAGAQIATPVGTAAAATRFGALAKLSRASPGRVTLAVQLLQSGTAFVVAAVLISALGSAQFGIFVLGQAAVLFVQGVAESAFIVPATVRLARHDAEGADRLMQRILPTMAGLLLIAMASVAAVMPFVMPAFGVPRDEAGAATWAIGAAAGLVVARELCRLRLVVTRRFATLLRIEFASNGLMLGVLLAWLYAGTPGAHRPFMALLLTSLAGVMPALLLLRGWRAKPGIRRHWVGKALVRRGGWSFVGSQLTWLQSQSYAYFVAALVSPAALGAVAAVRLLFAPLQTLITGWSRGLLIDLSAQAHERIGNLTRTLRRATLRIVLLNAGWVAVVVVMEPWLQRWLKGKGYDFDLWLIVAWSMVFLANGLRTLVTQALRAMQCYRELTLQGAVGAALSVVLIPTGIFAMGGVGALAGLAVVEASAGLLGVRSVVRAVRAAARGNRS